MKERETYNETMEDAPKCIDLFSGCRYKHLNISKSSK